MGKVLFCESLSHRISVAMAPNHDKYTLGSKNYHGFELFFWLFLPLICTRTYKQKTQICQIPPAKEFVLIFGNEVSSSLWQVSFYSSDMFWPILATVKKITDMGTSFHRSRKIVGYANVLQTSRMKNCLDLRASLCKILISSFVHKMDFAHNFSVDFIHF